ncbi:dihydrofolate reductase [Chelativorans sp. M5D2P16]|uniref:dihydrofolate reductase n=1 Tax=Chelativorans sp. M5D2P16 TaxID=3095678 RepID=UPI002AC9F567|nr:dihydrofolate reductase [Chelativorans sp. M5D2P16]MDZ5698202.1 dihydrofolate reductase [Chelativorans sp. M5D2P16]
MKIALVVAVARNGVIGREGTMPWWLSTDLKRFKAITMGKPIVMGRKTWESIGRPLPGRLSIVISRNPAYRAEGAVTVGSLEAALQKARGEADEAAEVCIIGGGEIFREALPLADVLHVTYVDVEVDGDAFFPAVDPGIWQAVSSEEVPAGEKDIYPTRYVVYQRQSAIGKPARPVA